jgi:hypothetical protein
VCLRPFIELRTNQQIFKELGKGKVVPVLDAAQCHEKVWERDVRLRVLLALPLDVGMQSFSLPRNFIPGERTRNPRNPWNRTLDKTQY